MVSMSPKQAITSKLTVSHTSTNFEKNYLETWLDKVPMPENRPTPIPKDASWIKKFNAAVGPTNPKIRQQQQKYKSNTKVVLVNLSGQ